MRRITKLFNTKATSINEATKTVTFRISDNKPDRMGEIVDQKSWVFKSYMKNPIVLWGHDPSEPENVLGTAATLSVADNGAHTDADITFDTSINPKAELVFNQIKAGTLKTVSVGFINHSEEYKDDIPVLKDNELLEISVVPIPANPRAIALSLKEGTLSRKDAKWLIDGMRSEAELLEKQLEEEDTPNERKKTMTEEQAQALMDGLTKLTETVEELKQENATLKDELSSLATTAEEETTEDETIAEDEKTTEDDKSDVANAGSDDQAGATTDELDPEAELTPEIQELIDSALEEQMANA